ncbi:hypothetical protein [Sphingomonas adhaesiva]|uniref:hypothetical protein n=1 Tax=Sphingomonas adhaesiva TaxID=28212 RepID=UPI002FF47C26
MIGNTPTATMVPAGLVGAAAHMASGFTVIFLWWFCLSCFDRRFRLRGGVLAIGLVWAAIAALDRGLFGDTLADKELSRLLVPLGFAIVGHLVWRLLAERQGDLIRQRSDARVMVAVLLGGMLFIDLAARRAVRLRLASARLRHDAERDGAGVRPVASEPLAIGACRRADLRRRREIEGGPCIAVRPSTGRRTAPPVIDPDQARTRVPSIPT